MILLGKIALGFGAGVLMIGAYTFHEGVIRVDVDENRANGTHLHFWAPAAIAPMALHLVPTSQMHIDRNAAKFMPLLHAMSKELTKYPDATFVEVQDGDQHAVVRTHNGSLTVDVDCPDQHVHVKVPLSTIDDVATQLAESAPPA